MGGLYLKIGRTDGGRVVFRCFIAFCALTLLLSGGKKAVGKQESDGAQTNSTMRVTTAVVRTNLATWLSVSRSTNPLLRRKLLQLLGSPWLRHASMRSPITWSSPECCKRVGAATHHQRRC